jgi:hypothetical protein
MDFEILTSTDKRPPQTQRIRVNPSIRPYIVYIKIMKNGALLNKYKNIWAKSLMWF